MSNVNLNVSSDDRNLGRQNEQAQQNPSQSQQRMNTSNAFSPWDYGAGNNSGTFGQVIHANSGSEVFNRIIEVMQKAIVASNAQDYLEVVPFAREVHKDLDFSVIVVLRNSNVPLKPGAPKHNYVMAQALFVESSGEVVRPVIDNSGRKPVTLSLTTEDANNSILVAYLTDKLQAKYPNQKISLIDPVILSRDMKLENENEIRSILDASVIAVQTRAVANMPGFQDYNFVIAHGGSDLQLPVTVNITGGETRADLTGRPIYTDADVVVTLERNNGRSNSQIPVFNSPDERREICSTGVMVDLVPVAPSLLAENRTGQRGRQFTPDAAWAPRLIARLTEQYLTRTPAGIMFAIASMSELARERMYAQTFRQVRSGGNKGTNYRDLGYLNIEARLSEDEEDERFGKVIDTRSSKFDDRALGLLLDNTVTFSPLLAVDCYTTGVQAYTTTQLYMAARGSKDAALRANSELMHSMNCATNGGLAKIIDLDMKLVDGPGDLVHVGYWYDNDNRKRDLAEVDNYLGMAVAAGTNNPQVVRDWTDTYFSRDPEVVRMSNRLQLLQSVTQGTVVVTGTALRAEINPEPIAAFVEALADGKLPVVSRNGEADMFSTQRSFSNASSRTLYRGEGFGRSNLRQDNRSGSRYAAGRSY